jgi:S-formylglutathione hydrolase FrmB
MGAALAVAAVSVGSLVVGPASPASAAVALPAVANPDAFGIDLQGNLTTVAGSRADNWLLDARMTSTALYVPGPSGETPTISPLAQELHVRILLPDGYDEHDTSKRYEVLYLLHGHGDTATAWTEKGGIRELVNGQDDFDGIVVMPEGGRAGWYSDWVGETMGHVRPLWETFHVDQLVPWIDANFNTVTDRSGRAIAGLSMGGLGALRYAARHPGVFSAVASFSGAVELRDGILQELISGSMAIYGAQVVDQGPERDGVLGQDGPGEEGPVDHRRLIFQYLAFPWVERDLRMRSLFGEPSPPVAPETRPGWPAVNPMELAAAGALDAYDGTVALYSGQSGGGVAGEDGVAAINNTLHATLRARGVIDRYCRGVGQHTWDYWPNDLRDFLAYTYRDASEPEPAQCTANPGWTEVDPVTP